jgi:hypothetical protein
MSSRNDLRTQPSRLHDRVVAEGRMPDYVEALGLQQRARRLAGSRG